MVQEHFNGTELYFSEAGEGTETIVFSHGYLMSHRMYDHQIDHLKKTYRTLAYDHRCHGNSECVTSAFGMCDLVEDAAAFIKSKCNGPVHFIGMSTGGFVGMRLALRHPDLIKTLTLIDTSADIEDVRKRGRQRFLMFVLRWFGVRPVVKEAMRQLMGKAFLLDPNRAEQRKFWRSYFLSLDKMALLQFGRAIFARDSVVKDLMVKTDMPPTLILVGEEDIATPPSNSEQMHDLIKGSTLVRIPRAGHTSPVEEPEAVTQELSNFFSQF